MVLHCVEAPPALNMAAAKHSGDETAAIALVHDALHTNQNPSTMKQ